MRKFGLETENRKWIDFQAEDVCNKKMHKTNWKETNKLPAYKKKTRKFKALVYDLIAQKFFIFEGDGKFEQTENNKVFLSEIKFFSSKKAWNAERASAFPFYIGNAFEWAWISVSILKVFKNCFSWDTRCRKTIRSNMRDLGWMRMCQTKAEIRREKRYEWAFEARTSCTQ